MIVIPSFLLYSTAGIVFSTVLLHTQFVCAKRCASEIPTCLAMSIVFDISSPISYRFVWKNNRWIDLFLLYKAVPNTWSKELRINSYGKESKNVFLSTCQYHRSIRRLLYFLDMFEAHQTVGLLWSWYLRSTAWTPVGKKSVFNSPKKAIVLLP